ncbi:N-acetylmuramoyl-L-alanine amidase family protein [Mucilaginibacter celer]|uniref:N-acetylmuramoyl-L-alanine amidase n=1 Tax=Mucilaginibacter celer TaxID=2305508 RepID=A0A494VYH3_9SPHI|nr:N-acetylmuramoyl-L-alanine amidase [Mucilaginibacter celer]AYL96378.1 N-acetylmuramoyl-L-alanine amidase [Mucilaginibacter celer]
MPATVPTSHKIIPLLSFLICLFICQCCYSQQNAPVANHFKFKTVIIDAGHGGKDPGSHGAYSKEKNVSLSIAKKLRDAINDEMSSVKVIMTRSTDVFIELHKRTDIANDNHGNLFISIHCNSSPQRKGTSRGTLLLVYGFHRSEEQREALRENASIFIEKDYKQKYNGYGDDAVVNTIVLNAFQQKYRKQSIRFGDLVDHQFRKANGRHSLGVKEQGVLVLAQSGMPAVLVETGFINNPADEEYLNSASGQNEIVRSIVTALKQYKNDLEGN